MKRNGWLCSYCCGWQPTRGKRSHCPLCCGFTYIEDAEKKRRIHQADLRRQRMNRTQVAA